MISVHLDESWINPKSSYPPRLVGAAEYVYAQREVPLRLWVYPARRPSSDDDAADASPAVIFFFGGSWRYGTPAQFAAQARYLASRGVTGIVADYRVETRNGTRLDAAMEDARTAVAWIRANAAHFGIDPARIAVGGGSAGGHLAAACATVSPAADSAPNALVLFNPVLVLNREVAPAERRDAVMPGNLMPMLQAWGVDPAAVCPLTHLSAPLPPTLVLHGRADVMVPFAASEVFVERARQLGSDATLVGYDEQTHGFFNVGRGGNWAFAATLRRVDQFFRRLGWVTGEPTIDASPGWTE